MTDTKAKTATTKTKATPKATPKAAPKAAPKAEPKPTVVWYESRQPEPTQFDVAGYGSIRRFTDNHLEWRVNADDVERFEKNHFYKNSRVVRKRDG